MLDFIILIALEMRIDILRYRLGSGSWLAELAYQMDSILLTYTDDEAIFYNLDRTRDSTRDINLGRGIGGAGSGLSDGFYVINDTDNRATFYNLDRTRNSRRDINLGSGAWEGGIDLSDGFYIIEVGTGDCQIL